VLYLKWMVIIMKKKKIDNNLEWYDNGFVITNIIISLIFLIIILSQSFAIGYNMSTINIFKNIINHNSLYLLLLIYFVSLKLKFGKKYFDYFNIFVIFIYFIATVTSLLTVFQAFQLSTLLKLALNALLLCYIFHTFLRSTKIWKEFKLNKSPFNELDNEWYFIAIIVISISMFTVGLISMTSGQGAILLFLDCLFNIFFARYIFLYRDYLDSKVKLIKSSSSKIDISEKIEDVAEDIISAGKNIKEKVEDFVEENEIDEKIEKVKDKVEDLVENATEEVTKKKKTVKNYIKEDKKEKEVK